jgi:23S rRNA pseudouridine2605 synthase
VASERLQKFLASAGIASRRAAETIISEGRVTVNNAVVRELGTKVDPAADVVTVDGKLVSRREGSHYYLLYKPAGCVTTMSDPQGRQTAASYLTGVRERVFPVGRLDYDAEGAVVFTDDGELAHRLMHPRFGHKRTYLVKVKGEPEAKQLERMVAGVRLEDGPARALSAVEEEKAEKNVWIRIEVGEGRFHLVKRLCEAVGLFVLRLYRPEFGGVTVEGLRPGHYRPLTASEVKWMRELVGLATVPEGKRRHGPQADEPKPAKHMPKAARRHGHGPPLPGGGSRPAKKPEPAVGAEPATEARPKVEPVVDDRRERRERPGKRDRRDRPERRPSGRGGRGGRPSR